MPELPQKPFIPPVVSAIPAKQPSLHDGVMKCERCGTEMYRIHGVCRCPACRFKTDCCGW